jgi:hypothetical protein
MPSCFAGTRSAYYYPNDALVKVEVLHADGWRVSAARSSTAVSGRNADAAQR